MVPFLAHKNPPPTWTHPAKMDLATLHLPEADARGIMMLAFASIQFAMIRSLFHFSLLFLPLFILCGCHATVERPPLPVPAVVVEPVLIRDVQSYIETTGTTAAFEFVEIPARVSGFLQEVRYAPGDIVSAGAPLFLIQPDQYQAEVRAAEGALASAQAHLRLMESNLARMKIQVERGASTQEELDTATAQRDESAATVIQAEAKLETANLNLTYTDVRSPITGKVDRNFVDVGNVVGPTGNNAVLTTVAGMDPIYVYFDVSDSQFNTIREHVRANNMLVMEVPDQQLQAGEQQERNVLVSRLEAFQLEFEINLIRGSEPGLGDFPFKGIIETAGNTIDQSTGTITIRGIIPNADYGIFPGQICRVRVPIWKIPDAVLVRQEAIGTDMNQRYVYVVDDKNTVHRRVVELGASQPDGTRLVTKGLERGERYVVSGIQRVRDGSEVTILDVRDP